MSYAIETKKRKFDRILEALSDAAAASPPRSSLNSRNNATTTSSSLSLSLDDTSDGSKRRRVTPTSRVALLPRTSTTSLSTHYLPSSRAAFLERLQTFRQVTQWHVPSTDPINATVWAKRGWICVDTDTVFCGSCKERVHVDLTIDPSRLRATKIADVTEGDVQDDQDDDLAMVTEVYNSIVKKYQDMITTAHSEGCLWRKRGSDSSVQRIEGLLNTSIALASLKERYDSIMTREDELPAVAPLPLPLSEDEESLTKNLSEEEERKVNLNAFRLAITGWDRKAEDIIECHHCFRSLGLWLYRGDKPAMETLDAIDSHLDYCPWKSADAQDTEVILPSKRDTNDESGAKKERVPGWILVYSAIVKGSNKKQAKDSPVPMVAEEEDVTTVGESLTSEQREKKTRDLFRRIKEIKKPFNVKALLNRKRDKQAAVPRG